MALYADVQLVSASAKYGSRKISLSVEMEGHRHCAMKQQNLVPGDGIGPNVCPFNSVGWLTQHELGALCRPFSPWDLSQ